MSMTAIRPVGRVARSDPPTMAVGEGVRWIPELLQHTLVM